MATWPETLPPPALNTFKEAPPNNSIRSQTDKGPAKVRRRTTANTRPLSFALKLTKAQVEIIDYFYDVTTYSGTDEFYFTHPRTEKTVSCRFVSPPSYDEQEAVIYNVNVSLEVMP